MALHLEWRGGATVPVEVEGITPDQLAGLTTDEIARKQVFEGKRATELAEFFQIRGELDDQTIVWQGDLRGVHWIGAKMTSGVMRIEGDAGRHIGSEMRGGELSVDGDVGDWVGAEMKGGSITVRGNAGHLVGAAYRGSTRGMTGGSIHVHGRAGNEVGHTLRRGLIAIGGDVGDLVGLNMLAGSVFMFGAAGIRHGAGMKRGTLAYFGGETPSLLPTFRHACRYQPLAIQLITRRLAEAGLEAAAPHGHATFDLYHGDLLEGGRGELLVCVPN